ncbi:MAG: DNA internalization-related competence protein ComEC/Rec2 [Methylotenera sp.]
MILATLMFVFGVWVVQQFSQLPNLPWLLCALVAAILIFVAQFHPRFSKHFHTPKFLKVLLLSAAVFLLGVVWASSFALWRMSDELPHLWEQKTIAIIGVVASVPEATERGTRFRFDVEKILTKGAIVPRHISLNQYSANPYGAGGDVLSKSSEEDVAQVNQFHAGERWLFSVRLKRPHGTQNPHGFDFESWALGENMRASGSIKSKAGLKKLNNFVWRPSYIIEHLREKTQQRITRVLAGKPYSGVIQALVMGDDSQISAEDWQVFLRTGTSHLMSISGLHITMLAGLMFGLVSFIWRRNPKLMMRLPTRKAAVLAGAATALAYALVAGFSVPTQRTFYMLLVFAVALWSGRQLVISQVLALALLVVVLFDPWAVSSPGFWLSFGAVAMLAYALGARIGEIHWFKAALQTQWAVTLGMLPLLLVMFNQASIISPIANAFAIPLISFVVTPLALLGSFLPIDALLNLSYKALEACMWALKWLNQLPMATWQQHEPATWTLFPATLGVLWLLLPRGFPVRWLGLLGFLPMLLIVPPRPMLGEMKVTVLDVGQGLSVVVQTATHTFLYDAGPKFNAQSDAGSRIVVPFLRGEGIRKIDGFMVSHNDIDHSGGMASILALMPVGWLNSSLPEETETPDTLEKMQCYAGQSWAWDSVDFEVLHPSLESYDDAALKDNYRSCVIKVTSQSGSILLTGDIEKDVELELLDSQSEALKSDVLIVPHHGSKTSSTADFIAAVAPSVSVFTPGYLNRYKHPKPEVLARYQATNSLLYRSDYQGALEVNFAKSNIKMVSWRSQYKRYWHDRFPIEKK